MTRTRALRALLSCAGICLALMWPAAAEAELEAGDTFEGVGHFFRINLPPSWKRMQYTFNYGNNYFFSPSPVQEGRQQQGEMISFLQGLEPAQEQGKQTLDLLPSYDHPVHQFHGSTGEAEAPDVLPQSVESADQGALGDQMQISASPFVKNDAAVSEQI